MELLTKNKPLTAVLAVLAVVGIGAYIYQLVGGLAVTGMSNGVSWGLYITCLLYTSLRAGRWRACDRPRDPRTYHRGRVGGASCHRLLSYRSAVGARGGASPRAL